MLVLTARQREPMDLSARALQLIWRRRVDTRRMAAGWLGIALLLANILLSSALSHPPIATTMGDGWEICTEHGHLLLDRDGNSLPQPDNPSEHSCAYCLPLSNPGSALVAFDEPVLIPPGHAVRDIFAHDQNHQLTPVPQPGGHARGPPLAA